MKNVVFYIDPMSYNNLAVYDSKLLNGLEGEDVFFFGNILFEEDINAKKFLIYRYSNKKGLFKIFSYLYSQMLLLKYIAANKPDVIHFQWFKVPGFDYRLLRLIKKISRKSTVIFTAHNVLPHDAGKRYGRIYGKIYRALDAIIVHHVRSKSEISERFNIDSNKIKIIPHGLLDIKANEARVEEIYKQIDVKDRIVFSMLGTLNDYKGLDLVVRTWESFSWLNTSKNMMLIIAGKGDESKVHSLRKYENVMIVNKFLENDEFVAYLRRSDVILLPYREISQSGLLLTALNERKLVIVSDKGGLTEPFTITNVGWILKDLSEESLNEAFINAQNLLTNNKFSVIENTDWKKLNNYYNWKRISKLTSDAYIKQTPRQ